ncbi:MAG: helix-turn-helix domain-containing protein [Breznakibacter sp.]
MEKKKDDIIHDDLVKLANRIKLLRIKQGYSNYESFAYEKNLPRAQYGRYEKGEDLRYSSLLKVIKALGMTPKEFFAEGFE